jgi:hypothetical protein
MVKNNSKKIVTDSCKFKNDKNGGLCPPYSYVAISLINRMGMSNLKILFCCQEGNVWGGGMLAAGSSFNYVLF